MARGMGIKDKKTKKEFVRYLRNCKSQRFFQAVVNFTKENLDSDIKSIYAGKDTVSMMGKIGNKYEDTFFWECDDKLGRN